jgi:Ca-activated chloride channel family protein
MHLRNDRVLTLLFLFLALTATAPSTAIQSPAAEVSGQTSNPPKAATLPATAQDAAAPSQTKEPPSASPEPKPQDQARDDDSVFVFKKEVEEVAVHATVVDEQGHMIQDLPKSAFSVFENGQQQTMISFRHEDIPVAMGVVVDNSGSMREKRDKVNKAALNLVRASNPQDQTFVVNFNDEYYLDQPFTGSVKKLQEALEKVEARGGTALYDALVASADYMKQQARLQKRVLFVVTDGEDNASRESLEEAVRRLQQENGPTVYAIGLLGEEKARRARRALETIAKSTGGLAFLPRSLDEVDQISRDVAHDIRSQYTLGYKPTTPKSAGGYRTIRVDARAKGYKKLIVRTRSGYYPGLDDSRKPGPGQ